MIQVMVWVTAIYYILGFLEGVFNLNLIKIIGYGILAFMGVALINHGFHDTNTYMVISMLFFLCYSVYAFFVRATIAFVPIIIFILTLFAF